MTRSSSNSEAQTRIPIQTRSHGAERFSQGLKGPVAPCSSKKIYFTAFGPLGGAPIGKLANPHARLGAWPGLEDENTGMGPFVPVAGRKDHPL
jgi:hypothetical protein